MFGLYQRQSATALMLGLAVTTSVVTPLIIKLPASAQSIFYDTQGHWAESCITQLVRQDIITGYRDGSFRPNLYINRAEFATIVGKTFPKTVQLQKSIQFVDVPTYYWAYDQILAASQAGFLSGYPGNIFKPNQRISRSQVLVALANGLNYSPRQNVDATLKASFVDANAIPLYARKSIAAATEKRLVVNYPNVKSLNPNKTATRADVAAFLCQALASSGEASVIPQKYIANTATSSTALKLFKNSGEKSF